MNWIIDNIIVRTLDMHGSIGLTSSSSRASHQQHALFGPVRSNSEWRARARRPTPVSVVPSADGVGVYWSGTIHGPGTPSRPGPFFSCVETHACDATSHLSVAHGRPTICMDRHLRDRWDRVRVRSISVLPLWLWGFAFGYARGSSRARSRRRSGGSWWDVVLASFRPHHEFVTHVHMAIYACREPFWARLTFLYGDGGWPPSEER